MRLQADVDARTLRKRGMGTLAMIWLAFGAGRCIADPIQVAPQPSNPDKFMGRQTTGVVNGIAPYTWNGANWYTSTLPLAFDTASTLQAQGLESPFLTALNAAFGAASGWSFNYDTNANIANNTFQVHTYQAQGPAPPASNVAAFKTGTTAAYQNCVSNNNCVGAQFYTSYVATGDDPTQNVHWIQLLYDNYGNGPPVDKAVYEVDNGGGSSPYYDQNFLANGSGFLDTPFTSNGPGRPVFFDALLLLATGPAANAPGPVTIYGGVTWGWSNQPVPEPSALALLACGLGLILIGTRRRIFQRARLTAAPPERVGRHRL